MARIALLVVAFLAASSAQAQVHKCVDAAGKIIYTQDPCPRIRNRARCPATFSRLPRLLPPPPTADSPADKAAAKSTAPKTAAEQETGVPPAPAGAGKGLEASPAEIRGGPGQELNCRNARSASRNTISAAPFPHHAQGSGYYMDDAQIEQEKSRARADMAQACN